ncbi:MAG: 3-phosphoshikimate 1-carboxyvinyltransferase [Spirochaetaceae bacterium]|jgi:3-phosphoshikimate 1-carboxyvinyltransferase|nr:3-phosphoshikimate 1-carboxyvinyltransferase [Spirochaetaceae bacterium]
MRAVIKPRRFSGTVRVPASKSHTIRRLLIAALADGVSEIWYPLDSLDGRSCAGVCRGLGAGIDEHRAAGTGCPNPPDEAGEALVRWTVRGTAGRIAAPEAPLDTGNSGTTLFLALAAAALGNAPVTFTGDGQIKRRSAGPLLDALRKFGVAVESAENGCVPVTVRGPWRGGRASVACPTSQYLSALLLAAPLAPAGTVTEIDVPLLNEKPYIELTLSYLDAQKARYEKAGDFSYFRIFGGASYRPLGGNVSGDFSSAAFPAAASLISGGGGLTLLGLDPDDSQGDKAFFAMLEKMGCKVRWLKNPASRAGEEWALSLSGPLPLKGGTFDLNATPDLLPVMAVLGAFAEGDTALVNAAHARIKETDRVAVMAEELSKLGVEVLERPDGLVVRGVPPGGRGKRPGTGMLRLDGHGDHRVVMALAAAALGTAGPAEISGAESAAVTYPLFLEQIGAEINIEAVSNCQILGPGRM